MRALRVFLSYNSLDSSTAESIASLLEEAGADVFLAHWLDAGVPWLTAIEERLASCQAMVVLLGAHGIGSWQQREIQLALDRQTTDEIQIVPVLLPGSQPPLGFLSLIHWVDLRAGQLETDGHALLTGALGLRPPDEEDRQTQDRSRRTICPFRGLEPFREEDAPFFFGREREIGRLRALLEDHTIVTLVGASGTGKSSLVRAGLIPRLRKEREPVWELVTMQPRRDPVSALAAVCRPLLEDASGQDELERLAWMERFVERLTEKPTRFRALVGRMLERQPGTDRMLIVVDQAEQLFAAQEEPTAAASTFLEAITDAAREGLLSVVVTLRAELLGRALADPRIREAVSTASVPLPSMGAEGIAAAIEKPAEALAIEIDPHLRARIVADLERQPGNLPLLQYALAELWRRGGGTRLRSADYDAFGGVERVIADRAESVYLSLDDEQRAAVPRLFTEALVHPGEMVDTRRRARLDELPPAARGVVPLLVEARLLVSGSKESTGAPTIEIAHEALLANWDRARAWIEEDREFLLWLQRLRAASDRWQGSDDRLWRAADLVEAERWISHRSELVGDPFLEASLAARRRRRRWQLAAIVSVLCFGVVATFLAVVARSNQRQVQARASIAEAGAHPDPAVGARILASLGPTHSVGTWHRALEVAQRLAQRPRSLRRFPNDDPVYTLQLSPDGRRAVMGSFHGVVYVWDLENHREPLVLEGHRGSVLHASWSPDGRRVVSASVDRTVRVWDVLDDTAPRTLRGHSESVERAQFSPDGRLVASASEDGTVRVWDIEGDSEPRVLAGHGNEVLSASFSPDGRLVVSASIDRTVRVWDLQGVAEPLVLDGHDHTVLDASFSPDGGRIVSASVDETVRIWDLRGGEETVVLTGHQDAIDAASFSPDGRRVVSASRDGTVRVWALEGQREPRVLAGHQGSGIEASWSPDGRRIVSTSADGTIRVWDVDGDREPLVLEGHASRVVGASFSPDGQLVVSASRNGTIRSWDVEYEREPLILESAGSEMIGALFSPDDSRVVVTSLDGAVSLWDIERNTVRPVLEDQGHWFIGWSVNKQHRASFSPEGSRLVAILRGGMLGVWDVVGDREPLMLEGGTSPVRNAAFSPDGGRVVAGSDDGTVRVWNVSVGAVPIVLGGHTQAVNSVSFSPDGRRVVSASDDRTVRLWDVVGDAEPMVLEAHDGVVYTAFFSPDGNRVVSASDDVTVRLWDVVGDASSVALEGHNAWVNYAVFSPDGSRVVSGASDGSVRVWDIEGGAAPRVLSGHRGGVHGLSWSPDGDRVVSASNDGTVRVWDVAGDAEPLVLGGHAAQVWSAAFTSDGKRIVTASFDGTVRVWKIDWASLVEYLDQTTLFCLTVDERQRYLFESRRRARAGLAACEKKLVQELATR